MSRALTPSACALSRLMADAHFRLAELQVAVDEGKYGVLARLFQKRRKRLAKRIEIRRLHDEAHAAAFVRAPLPDAGFLSDVDPRAHELPLQDPQIVRDLILRARPIFLLPEKDAHETGVHRTRDAVAAAGARHLRHHEMGFGHMLGGGSRQSTHVVVHVVVAHALGSARAPQTRPRSSIGASSRGRAFRSSQMTAPAAPRIASAIQRCCRKPPVLARTPAPDA